MKTPEGKRIVLTFHSRVEKDPKLRWKVSVAFPPGAGDETPAEVLAVDGEGIAIEKGEFEFAGMRIAICGGKGVFRCGDFAAGKHESALWLYRPEMMPVPGILTFE